MMGGRLFSLRQRTATALGLAVASWTVLTFAVWSPLWGLPPIFRGEPLRVLELIAVAGTVVVTLPLFVAVSALAVRALVWPATPSEALEEADHDAPATGLTISTPEPRETPSGG